MIILREKTYSREEGKRIVENDAAHMTNFGRVGLQASAGLGGLAAIETGRSLYHGARLYKKKKDLEKLKDDPKFRKVAKKIIKEQSEKIPIPGLGDSIIEKIRFAERNAPKFDKIDKINTAHKWWKRVGNLNRTILNNLGDYTEKGVNDVISKHSDELGETGIDAMKKLPGIARRVGKMGVALKNAKGLGKAAAGLGSASGLLYLNGRSLENGTDRPVTR